MESSAGDSNSLLMGNPGPHIQVLLLLRNCSISPVLGAVKPRGFPAVRMTRKDTMTSRRLQLGSRRGNAAQCHREN